MRKLTTLSTLFLMCFCLKAQIMVKYPNGGEKYPQNVYIRLGWTNGFDGPACTLVILQRFDEGLDLVEEIEIGNFCYGEGDHQVGTSYRRHFEPGFVPPVGAYKLSVVGFTESGGRVDDTSDDFFFITEKAFMNIVVDNTPWLPGESKTITLSWSNFQIGNPYSLLLVLGEGWYGEGYGFRLDEGVVDREHGEKTVEIPYPSEDRRFHELDPGIPVDGFHSLIFRDEQGYISSDAELIDLIVSELRLRYVPQQHQQVRARTSVTAFKFIADARFSPNDVHAFTLPMSLWRESADTELWCVFYENNKRIHGPIVVKGSFPDKYDRFVFSLSNSKRPIVKRGEIREIELRCNVRSGTGLFNWAFDFAHGIPEVKAYGLQGELISAGITPINGWSNVRITDHIPARFRSTCH